LAKTCFSQTTNNVNTFTEDFQQLAPNIDMKTFSYISVLQRHKALL